MFRRVKSVNLYGGLGNQIFQLLFFYSSIASHEDSKNECLVNLYYLKKYSAKRNFDSKLLCDTLDSNYKTINKPDFFLIYIINRLVRKISRDTLFSIRVYDGYFQKLELLNNTQLSIYKELVSLIGKQVKIVAKTADRSCIHLRLTDFNQTKKQKENEVLFISNYIKANESFKYDLITDDLTQAKNYLGSFKQIKSFSTFNELSSLELLKIMMSYPLIINNGSTLSFWAAIFSKAKFITSDSRLMTSYTLLWK